MSRNIIDTLKEHRGMVAVVAGALTIFFLGAAAVTGYWLSRDGGSGAGKPDQPIEWHAVQAVATRAPDTEDVVWQDRSNAIDAAQTNATGNDSAETNTADSWE